MLLDSSGEFLEDSPKEFLEEFLAEPPEELLKESPEELLEKSPEEFLEESPMEFLEESPEEFLKESPEEYLEKSRKEIPVKILGEITEFLQKFASPPSFTTRCTKETRIHFNVITTTYTKPAIPNEDVKIFCIYRNNIWQRPVRNRVTKYSSDRYGNE